MRLGYLGSNQVLQKLPFAYWWRTVWIRIVMEMWRSSDWFVVIIQFMKAKLAKNLRGLYCNWKTQL